MPQKRKGARWRRINKKILSEFEYLAEFEAVTEASFAAAEIIAAKVAQTLSAQFPDAQAELRNKVERALLRAAPSEALTAARQAAIDVLGVEAVIPDLPIGIEANSLIGGTIQSRAEMYTDATYATFENNVLLREMDEGVNLGRRVLEEGDNCDDCIAASTEEFVPLDTLPEIGDSVCGPRCRCEFEFDISGVQFATSELFSARIGGQEDLGGSVDIN